MIASTQTNHPFAGQAGDDPQSALIAAVTARIHSAGGRVTQPRIAMLRALAAQGRPVTIEQIHRDVGADKCDLVTIYRSMAAFEDLGVVKRSFFHNGTVLYELSLDRPARYHVVCKATNRVDPIDPELTAELQRAIDTVQAKLRAHGYAAVNHRVEFFAVGPVVAGSTSAQ
ncbi:MAG: transcriptional repressor [Opitutaceae bacterium]|nr:transcriptional repressor [Opitutaceae bacterium]